MRARRGGTRRLLVCLPTGAGKTVIFSELARLAKRPVLVLAHRKELVDQARDKLSRALSDPSVVAIEQADTSAHPEARIVVASIRSLREDRLARLMAERKFGLIIYDECHHAPAEDNMRVLRALGIAPSAWHANEGHAAFMLVERVRELMSEGVTYEEAVSRVRSSSIFTTHTPVAAALGQNVVPRMPRYGARAAQLALLNALTASEPLSTPSPFMSSMAPRLPMPR